MPAAQVLIDGPSELVFDYAIPKGLHVEAGHRVRIPLRNRPAIGTVLKVHEPEDQGFDLRPLHDLVDPEPLVTAPLLALANWMAGYYGTPLEHIIRSLLPEAVRQENHSAKTIQIAIALPNPDENAVTALAKRAPRQHSIYSLLQAAGEAGLPVSQLGEGANKPAQALAEKGLIKIKHQEIQRDPDQDEVFLADTKKELNPEQAAALKSIIAAIDSLTSEATPASSPAPFLLHGVTGSGKTEVYLQATEAALAAGKTVIVLLPEISLTPQTVQRFKSRFSEDPGLVAVLHSTLTQGERFDEWHRIRKGEARVVVGARSAIFAPIPDLGLILVDEEHETTYKQENPPKYHGRDLAVVRAHLEGAVIALGSATPSLESYSNATLRKKYRLLNLTQRADGQALPLIRIVDMRNEPKKGGPAILSQRLRHAMEQKLTTGDQIILFLNRRGFARSLTCPSCGETCECAHCSIPTTYHRAEERLICHLCGYQAIVPRVCPKCQDPSIRLQGFGTEKVEEVLRKVFPKARLARLDGDTVRKKHVLKRTLTDFKARKIDILLGTQMIAKGLDFPNVTLVGVLNADLSLNAPDFRASERTFSLLTQVAGRAGRGALEGEVFIQTFVPHAPAIQYARHHDFEGFVEQELDFRQKCEFPPFCHLAVLSTRSRHEKRAEFTLQTIHRRLSEDPPPGLIIGEPNPNPIVRAHDLHRFQLLLRHPSPRTLTRHIHQILNRLPTPEDVTLVVDIDAHDFS